MKMRKTSIRHWKIYLISLSLLTASIDSRATEPGVAGFLSIIPGLGQVSNGDVGEGALWFVSSVGLFSMRGKYAHDIGYKIWQYNIYDAYRDAGAPGAAKQSVFENYLGAFNPLNIADPVGAGIIGYGTARTLTASSTASLGPRNRLAGAFYYGFVGLGEEGLFRGALFNGLSNAFSSQWAGAILSSAAFSASHLFNEQAYYHSAGGLTELFLLGMAFCWQTSNNRGDLRPGIFAHTWYDFIIDYGGKKATGTLPDTLGLKMSVQF